MRNHYFLLFLLIVAIGCEPNREPETITTRPPDAELTSDPPKQPEKPVPAPRIWLDEDAAAMIKLTMGYDDPNDRVTVIRWEHSSFSGWVKLDSPAGASTLSFDLGVPTELAQSPGIENVSGWIVVAMRMQSGASGQAYDVRIEQQFTWHQGNASETRGFESRRGTLLRVPPDVVVDSACRVLSRWHADRFELMRCQDGQSVPWLSVRLGSHPFETEDKAELSHAPEPAAGPVSNGASSPPAR